MQTPSTHHDSGDGADDGKDDDDDDDGGGDDDDAMMAKVFRLAGFLLSPQVSNWVECGDPL